MSSNTITWAHQCHLPKLPIPPLEDTCRRYLAALKGLQDEGEHENTVRAVQAFLHGDGPHVQEMLLEYSKDKNRCVQVSCNPLDRARCSLLLATPFGAGPVTSKSSGTIGLQFPYHLRT